MSRPGKRKIVEDLLRQGKSVRYISAAMDMAESTIRNYKAEMGEWEIPPAEVAHVERKEQHAPGTFKFRWTIAVNRLRRGCGREPFPLPDESRLCTERGCTAALLVAALEDRRAELEARAAGLRRAQQGEPDSLRWNELEIWITALAQQRDWLDEVLEMPFRQGD